MSGIEYELFTKWQREMILKNCLAPVRESAAASTRPPTEAINPAPSAPSTTMASAKARSAGRRRRRGGGNVDAGARGSPLAAPAGPGVLVVGT